MGSTGADRPYSSGGAFLPQWVKNRIGDRYDSDQAASSSLSYPKAAQPEKPSLLTDAQKEAAMTQPTLKENVDNATSHRSVIDVAHNTIFGNFFGGGNKTKEVAKNPEILNEANTYNHRQRRNSKSLPASPLSSPKVRRQRPEKFLTDPFKRSTENVSGTTGWLWATLMSTRVSLDDLGTESEGDSPATRRRDTDSIWTSTSPAEIREMNCWSPTTY